MTYKDWDNMRLNPTNIEFDYKKQGKMVYYPLLALSNKYIDNIDNFFNNYRPELLSLSEFKSLV